MFIIAHKEKLSRDVFIPGRRIYMAIPVSAMLDRALFFMLLNFPVIVLASNKKTVLARIIWARQDSSFPNNATKKILAGQFLSRLSGTIFPISLAP